VAKARIPKAPEAPAPANDLSPPIVLIPISHRVDSAAKLLGVGKTTVWDLIWREELAAHKIRGATVILHEDLVEFVRRSPRFKPQHPPDA
jgi:excisionase family DNA binding protein